MNFATAMGVLSSLLFAMMSAATPVTKAVVWLVPVILPYPPPGIVE